MQSHIILDHYYDHICVMEKLEKLKKPAQITKRVKQVWGKTKTIKICYLVLILSTFMLP